MGAEAEGKIKLSKNKNGERAVWEVRFEAKQNIEIKQSSIIDSKPAASIRRKFIAVITKTTHR